MAKLKMVCKWSERNSQSDLAFTSRQHLCYRSERLSNYVHAVLNRGRVLTVQQIEKLEQRLDFNTFSNTETLGEAQIDIDKCRCGKGISPGRKIDAVEICISIRVPVQRIEAAEMKTALSSKDAAELKLPRKFYQSVDLKDVLERKARWTLIQIRTVYKCSRRSDEITVPA